MSTTAVRVGESGSITLPEELREAFGLAPGVEVVAEPRADGVLLRVAAPPKAVWDEIAAMAEAAPAEEQAKLPPDLAAEHDHYLYGTPKRHG